MFVIFNSQTRKKEEFKPIDPGGKRVTMYFCGPTVYNHIHIGNARSALSMDIIRRYIEFKGYNVRYATNFTDIDDRIIKKAIKEERDWREVNAEFIAAYHGIFHALNIKPADVYPR